MGAHPKTNDKQEPLKLSPIWGKVPMFMIIGGLVLVILGYLAGSMDGEHKVPGLQQVAFSYLTAYMFFLSLALGGLFLVLLHHLFDANWSVAIRRVVEHMAMLIPVMFVLWIPIALFALNENSGLYSFLWNQQDHAVHAKYPLFTKIGWFATIIFFFSLLSLVAWKLRSNSLNQDKDGAAKWTRSSRVWTGGGIYIFGVGLTFLCIMLMKSLMYQFFSTMYGVYYFAGSVWVTYATVYLITLILKRTGPLAAIVTPKTMHTIGTMFFAFTVFYAYIAFSQYFLIWNANLPEETFWFVRREVGSWWLVGMLMIFGHFFLPFLAMLRIDAKLNIAIMFPLIVWAWLMHYMDMQFNVMPSLHTSGFVLTLPDIGFLALFAGVLSTIWLKMFKAHPAYPQKDPRMAEMMGVYVPPAKGSVAALHLGLK
jgi:hypothetical protein